jgi:hypothetical protein
MVSEAGLRLLDGCSGSVSGFLDGVGSCIGSDTSGIGHGTGSRGSGVSGCRGSASGDFGGCAGGLGGCFFDGLDGSGWSRLYCGCRCGHFLFFATGCKSDGGDDRGQDERLLHDV